MKITLLQGDITKMKVDAVVNAANTSLLGGGGVDGAIHRAGGPEILDDCKKIRNRQGGCKVGEAVYTTAGKLDASYVIHTVGPRYNNGNSNEAALLKQAYENSLKLADYLEVKSIAFPNISTGIYGYPKSEAAELAIKTVKSFETNSLEEVFFVCFDQENYQIYKRILND